MSLYHAAFFLALTLTLAAPTSHKQSHTQPDLQLRGNHLHKFLQRASSIASSKLLEGNSSPLTDVLTLPASERQSGGFTGDPCQSGDECRGTRNCLTAADEVSQLCEPGDICICFQLSICSSNADCEEGERCFEFKVPSAGTVQACVSNNQLPQTTSPGGTTTAAPTTTAPVTTGGDPDDDDEVCFPASAIVHLANGEKLRMDELQAGHEVEHDTLGRASKIFLFTHRTKDHQGWFYQLTTESGHSITLTGNHYIYADDRLTTADSVKRGDKLRTISGDSAVTRIRRVTRRGLYAPHSLHGDLVVDGIVVSGYSRAVHPSVAHALLTPVRWFVRKTGVVEPLGAMLYGGGRGVEKIMLKGADKY